jgi:hypothetical protein
VPETTNCGASPASAVGAVIGSLPSPRTPGPVSACLPLVVYTMVDGGECMRGTWKLGQPVRVGEVWTGIALGPEGEVGSPSPSPQPLRP